MTVWEYAIARHVAQLLAESAARVLTARETDRLMLLSARVEAYEAGETAGVHGLGPG